MGDQSETVHCPSCDNHEFTLHTKENGNLDVHCADCEGETMMVKPLAADERLESVLRNLAE